MAGVSRPLFALGLSIFLVSACGAGLRPLAPLTMPAEASARRQSLSELGQRLFEGLRGRGLSSCFASVTELDTLIVPEVRFRRQREREASVERVSANGVFQRDWALASYAGFCAQGAREEPPGNGLGLTQRGWVLERILVVASLGDGQGRSAAWLEGAFVYTEQGWKALNFRRVEPPRRHHSDLDLAPCDVESGVR